MIYNKEATKHFPALSYEDIPENPEGFKYRLLTPLRYYCAKYDKFINLEYNDLSDGATGAFDIRSWCWWLHDNLCASGKWEDGTPCTNWQASTVIGIALAKEKRYLRSVYWWWATWLAGGGKAKENGMW